MPVQVLPLATHLRENCPDLNLVGLMTIGAPGESSCFQVGMAPAVASGAGG
jgi:uncharacterized pyridoxal phosphate-containing UPF0001 family protein